MARITESKPFFINVDRDTGVRTDLSKFMLFDVDSYDVNTAQIFTLIRELPVSGEYTVQGQDGRPDLVSYEIYNDTQYWWVLLIYNGMTDTSEIVHADTLRFPDLQSLEDLFFSLKVNQTKADT